MSIKVKACLKCKEFIALHDNYYENKKLEKEFESTHDGHNLIIISKQELTKHYVNFRGKKI